MKTCFLLEIGVHMNLTQIILWQKEENAYIIVNIILHSLSIFMGWQVYTIKTSGDGW